MTTVINLLAGPAAGKSTTAAALFVKMKLAGYKVELITEYAKDLVYADRKNVLEHNQLYIFAKQNYRLSNTIDKVDYVITDTCLLFSNIYPDFYGKHISPSFRALVHETFDIYDNLNFYLDRPDHFEEFGRVQNLEESLRLDEQIINLLNEHGYPFIRVQADTETVDKIFRHIEFQTDALNN